MVSLLGLGAARVGRGLSGLGSAAAWHLAWGSSATCNLGQGRGLQLRGVRLSWSPCLDFALQPFPLHVSLEKDLGFRVVEVDTPKNLPALVCDACMEGPQPRWLPASSQTPWPLDAASTVGRVVPEHRTHPLLGIRLAGGVVWLCFPTQTSCGNGVCSVVLGPGGE